MEGEGRTGGRARRTGVSVLSSSSREMYHSDLLGSDVDEEVDGTRGLGDSLDVGVVRKGSGGVRHGG